MKRLCQFAAALALAPVVAYAGTITPPKDCTAYLTVQMKSCEVSHHWKCEGDAEGDHWALSIDGDGPVYLQHLDREFRWLQSFPQRSDISRELVQPEVDANSFTQLLETRRDDFDFRQRVLSGGKEIAMEHITGYDRLNGTRVTIDGEELLVTEFEIRSTSDSGSKTVFTTGNQYVSARFRLFFQGRETEVIGLDSYQYDDTPVLFIEPGEAGFLADKPEFGCDQMMSEVEFPKRNSG
ncbi:MAG: hypothetical protein KAT26_03315 [Marinosulfonomonas sp.]|nr:hypothetical protein [Marinosulfonomonas sp.]